MPRFNRNYALNTSMPDTGQSAAYQRLASSLDGFISRANQVGSRLSIEQAKRDAGEVKPSEEAPELRSPLSVYGRNYNAIVLEGHLAETQNAYRKQLSEIADANPADPLAFQKGRDEIRGKVLSGVSPEVKQSATIDFDRYANSLALDIDRNKNKIETEKARIEVTTAFDSTRDSIFRYLRQGDERAAIEEAGELKQAIIASEVISPEEKKERLKALDQGITEQSMLNSLEGMELGDAWNILDQLAKDVPENYSPEEWDSFISEAQTTLNRRDKRESEILAEEIKNNAVLISNVKVAINTGQGDMVALAKKVDELHSMELITTAERTSLMMKINNRAKGAASYATTLAKVKARIDGDKSVLLENKEIDEVYEKEIFPAKPNNALKAQFAQDMSYIPKQMAKEVINGLRSGDSELIIQSSDLIDRLNDVQGIPFSAFSTEDRALAKNVIDLMGYMPADKAVAMARKNTDPSDMARIEARHAAFEEKVKKRGKRYEDARREMFVDVVRDRMDFTIFGNTVSDLTQYEMAEDMATLVENHFVAGMDYEDALDEAEIDMRTWGVSNATGTETTMKLPPEMFCGKNTFSCEGDMSFLQKQLKADVEAKWQNDYDKIHLRSDETTEREASLGDVPSYRVLIQTEEGITPLVGVRWKPAYKEAVEKTIKEYKQSFVEEKADFKLRKKLREDVDTGLSP